MTLEFIRILPSKTSSAAINETFITVANNHSSLVECASLLGCYYWLISANKQLIHIRAFPCAR